MFAGWRDEPSPQSPDVEFLDAWEVTGEDELLPEPAPATGPLGRRVVMLAAVIVLAVLVAAALVNRPESKPAPRAAARTGASRQAVPGVNLAATPQRIGDILVPGGGGGYVVVHDGIAIGPVTGIAPHRPPLLDLPRGTALLGYVVRRDPCPNRVGCTIGTSPTPHELAALRAALPGVRDVDVASMSEDARLTLLAVRARVGGRPVEILVRPADPSDGFRFGTLRRGHARILYARAESDGFTVDVQVRGPGPDISQLALLAADSRLVR